MTASRFATVASEVHRAFSGTHTAAADRDAEWQRVNSYIADVLKDSHVLYAKLARLQSDFTGHELSELENISEEVLKIGEMLSHFSKAFYDGKLNMAESSITYGDDGAPVAKEPQSGPPGGHGGGEEGGGGGGGHEPPPEDYDVPVHMEEEESAPEPAQAQ